MKRKILSAVALLIAILCIPASLVFAHSGGTDENGGHWDYEAGEYHYHHGYPAHQHPNGVCPYLSETSEDSTDTYYSSSQQDDDNVGGYFINDDVSSRYSELSDAAEQLGGNYTTKVLTDISSAAYRDGYQEGYEDGLAYRKENPSAAAASTARGDAETISELGGYTGKDYNVAVSSAYDEGYSDAIALEYGGKTSGDIYTEGYAEGKNAFISEDQTQAIITITLIALSVMFTIVVCLAVSKSALSKKYKDLEVEANDLDHDLEVAENLIQKQKEEYNQLYYKYIQETDQNYKRSLPGK